MSGFLDRLEMELVAAAQRSSLHEAQPAVRGGRVSLQARMRLSARILVAVAALLLAVAAAAALAATGILFTGAAVPPTPDLSKDAGLGLPEPGHARLIARSVPDPLGGLPWSMRLVHTTRGLMCLQIGRLDRGRIGVLGQDGAFHDDGLFHPLSPETLGSMPRDFATACEPQGETFSEDVIGMPQSAQLPREGTIGRPAQERRLYYGLLGPSAVSVTYREGAVTRKAAVEPGTGAYLIVMPGERRSSKAVYTGGVTGLRSRSEGRVRAIAPLLSITYRVHGRICVEAGARPAASDPCPRESAAQLARRVRALEHPQDLHVPIHVRLQAMQEGWWRSVPTRSGSLTPPPGAIDGAYYAAAIEFKAPFAVENADSGYSVSITAGTPPPRGGGGTIGDIERDVRRGAIVRTREQDLFANFPGRAVTISVYYHDLRGQGRRSVLVGSTTVGRP